MTRKHAECWSPNSAAAAPNGPFGKTIGYALDIIVGYGYQPVRAFIWLIVLLAVGSVYFTINRPAALDPAQHPHYQPVLYAADLVIPIVDLGQAGIWAPIGAAHGELLHLPRLDGYWQPPSSQGSPVS